MANAVFRRWFRFRLRSLLIAVAVIAVLIWIPVKRATEQRDAVNAILRLGGIVRYDFESAGSTEPSAPVWLRRLIGEDYFRRVDSVNLNDLPVTDDELALLRLLPALEKVEIRSCAKVSDKGLIHLRELSNLRRLDLQGTQITDDGLKYLTALPALTASLSQPHTDHR